jgi:hypothetical protein
MLRARPGRAFANRLVPILLAALGLTAASAQAQLTTHPLLPLVRGQVIVSLGTAPQWQPVSGEPLDVTLFSGRPAERHASALTAYVALQSTSRACTASPAGDHVHPLIAFPGYYARADLIANETSAYVPQGGAAPGDYGLSRPDVVVHQHGATRACVWLARRTTQRSLVLSEQIPLLNGLFAAAVTADPTATLGDGSAYSLQAIDVTRTFRYTTSTTECGTVYTDPATSVAPESDGDESVAYGPASCSSDGSAFAFTSASGGSLGMLTYTVAEAEANPPEVGALGGCELDGLTVTPVAFAEHYVQAVGCEVGRLLVSPFQSAYPRGDVLEAQVDGGLAEIAPAGTTVDLVLNGRP